MLDGTQQRLEQLSAHGIHLRTKPADMTYGDLIHSLTQNLKTIGHKEMALAKNEFQEAITAELLMTRRLIIGSGFIVLGASALLVFVVMALSVWVSPWLTALALAIFFITSGATIIVVAWKHHVNLTEVQDELKETLKWSKNKAR